ncbi:MAG TPA: hypothetical protein VF174_00435 [Micromonosporaceae bacterium]
MPDEAPDAGSTSEPGADAPASGAEVPEESPEATSKPRPDRSWFIRRITAWLPRLSPVGQWMAGVAAAVVAALATSWVMALQAPEDRTEELPFTVAVGASQNATIGWISDRPLSQLPTRPSYQDDWSEWVSAADAVPVERHAVHLVVQGRSDAQVTILDMKVRVLARRPPITGTHFRKAGGDAGSFRWVAVDLDTEPPEMSSGLAEELLFLAPEHERRPIRFPYRVSLSDAETFVVEAYTQECDCYWVIELSWASQGRTGTTVIDDGGRPFRLSGLRDAVAGCFTYSDREECEQL